MTDLATGDSPPNETPTIRVVAMPSDTNPAGDIFGGWIVSQMDLAAGTQAAQRVQGRCVTVAIDSLTFHQPVVVGDEVSIYTRLLRTGRTSMAVSVETWRRARHNTHTFLVTKGIFTFVAIGEDGRPRPLPPEESLAA